MPNEIFAEREQALENEFFYHVDQQLLQNLRHQKILEADGKALADATGINDKRILDELITVGIRRETLQAFRLFPAIYVAWCDRVLDTKERDQVLSAVDQAGFRPDTSSYQLIAAWLKQPPGPELFAAWKDYVASLSTILSCDAFDNLKSDALDRAKKVAQAAGGVLGISTISDKERTALMEIEAIFAMGDDPSEVRN